MCTGNICRSPTAERLALVYATERRFTGFCASSAGTRAVVSHGMHRDAAAVLLRLGGDASNFTARQLKSRHAREADLVLTMEKNHRDAVLEIAPAMLKRTFTLLEASRLIALGDAKTVTDLANLRASLRQDGDLDIFDPIGESFATFDSVGRQIAGLLPPIIDFCEQSGG